MAYVKNTWVDQKVQRPKTYNFTTNDDGSTTLIDAFGNVEELGTPVNADNMNHIEEGLSNVGTWAYSETVTYDKDDAVIGIVDDNFVLCRSLQNGNKGNPLTNTDYWEEVNLGGGSGYNLFDLKYSDHILEGNEAKGFALLGSYAYKTAVAGSRYGYPDFYNKCVAEKIAGTETTITVGNYSFTGYKNANGHIFFDIANKGTVDNIYTSTGKAWYYGIDTANERIFLPRVKNALVGMTDIADTSAVVPNTTNPMPQFTVHNDPEAVGNLHTFSVGGHPYNQVHWNGRQGNNNGNLLWTTKGNTGLLSDNANVKSALNNDNFYIYMCVGNTEQEGAVTDVIDITTSENDTLPLGWSTYQSGGTPSSAFLASLGQQNSGTLYPTFYNTYVAKIGQAFGAGFVKAHTASDITDYDLVINQDEQTFRLPLIAGRVLVESKKPTVDDPTWYNLYSDGWLEQGGLHLIPSGSNDCNLLKAYKDNNYTITIASTYTNNTGEEAFDRFEMVSAPNTTKYQKTDKFRVVISGTVGARYMYWNTRGYADRSTISTDLKLYYKVSNAVQNLQLLDVAGVTTTLANKQDKCIHIIDTYVNGTSGYRIWSDGYCEQWGRVNISGTDANNTVNFVKTFKDTNYVVVEASFGNTDRKLTLVSLRTSNMVIKGWSNTSIWKACGYLASGQY